MLAFVYGTLRKGYGNHPILEDSLFVGNAKSLPQYTMLHLGGFPGVVAGGTTSIVGELYDVDDETLANLDRLEGHPNFYKRASISVHDGCCVWNAETYLLPVEWLNEYRQAIIKSGDWSKR